MNWKMLIMALIMFGGIIGTVSAASVVSNTKGLEISEAFTYATENDSGGYEIGAKIEISNNLVGINNASFPLKIFYYYNGMEVFNVTKENSGFSKSSMYKKIFDAKTLPYDPVDIEVMMFDMNGQLIDLKSQHSQILLFDFRQKKADIQLVNINVTEKKSGIFGLGESSYNVIYTLKNTNNKYAFKGTLEFGDLGIMPDWKWKFEHNMILGPSESINIERPGLTEKELTNLQTELETCMFC